MTLSVCRSMTLSVRPYRTPLHVSAHRRCLVTVPVYLSVPFLSTSPFRSCLPLRSVPVYLSVPFHCMSCSSSVVSSSRVLPVFVRVLPHPFYRPRRPSFHRLRPIRVPDPSLALASPFLSLSASASALPLWLCLLRL